MIRQERVADAEGEMMILCPLPLLTPSWESNPTALPVKLKPLFEPKYQHQSSKFVHHFHSFNSCFFFLFNLQVKQFHPDLNRDENETSDVMIRRVIQAYQVLLSSLTKSLFLFYFFYSLPHHMFSIVTSN